MVEFFKTQSDHLDVINLIWSPFYKHLIWSTWCFQLDVHNLIWVTLFVGLVIRYD